MNRLLALFLLLALAIPQAHAQGLEIEIKDGVASALPITIVPMPYLGTSVAPDHETARAATTHAVLLGAHTTTRSPRRTPASR